MQSLLLRLVIWFLLLVGKICISLLLVLLLLLLLLLPLFPLLPLLHQLSYCCFHSLFAVLCFQLLLQNAHKLQHSTLTQPSKNPLRRVLLLRTTSEFWWLVVSLSFSKFPGADSAAVSTAVRW